MRGSLVLVGDCVVGIGAGATLALRAASECSSIERVALYEPVVDSDPATVATVRAASGPTLVAVSRAAPARTRRLRPGLWWALSDVQHCTVEDEDAFADRLDEFLASPALRVAG